MSAAATLAETAHEHGGAALLAVAGSGWVVHLAAASDILRVVALVVTIISGLCAARYYWKRADSK